jgi:hypothetical protein
MAPNVTHLIYFIRNLFENEISKMEIKLPPRKKPKEIVKKIKKVVEDRKYPIKEPESVGHKIPPVQPTDEPVSKDILFLEEEFEPAVEINFDKAKNKNHERFEDEKIRSDIFNEFHEGRRNGKKGFFIVVIVLALLAGGYFTVNEFVLKKSNANKILKNQVVTKTESGMILSNKSVSNQDHLDNPQVNPYQNDVDAINFGQNFEDQEIIPQEELEGQSDGMMKNPNEQKSLVQKDPIKVQVSNEITKKIKTPIIKQDSKKIVQNKIKKPVAEPVKQQNQPDLIVKKETEEDKTKTNESDKNDEQENLTEVKSEEVLPKEEVKVPPKLVVTEGMVFKSLSEVDVEPVLLSKIDFGIKKKHLKQMRNPSESIVVSYLIDHHGNVLTAKMVRRSSNFEINLLITSAIRRWKFKPSMKDGMKVKVWVSKRISLKK